MEANDNKVTREDVLRFHEDENTGKIGITTTKPLTSPHHLSLAYSPGVAIPCEEIKKNPEAAYKYTAKSHMVAVISNGTAVLGLGNLGALASKPVMEGKAALFKKFGDIDAIDIEVNTEDVDEFINCVKLISISFGGINLEDIKAPECFIIEKKLKEITDIPVFHDDQHGTAICTLAGLINALEISNKSIKTVKMVVNGAGSAAIACTNLAIEYGLDINNVIMCDSKGVIHNDRKNLNEWKQKFAIKTEKRTLEDAMEGADIFFGLSTKNVISEKMLLSMASNPIIFAMANPDPEIDPAFARSIRDDIIIATGRSDYSNQVNNLLAFPYIFRGALEVRATEINEPMKLAAAKAIAKLAKEKVPQEVGELYGVKHYGKDYIIPTPFDPRLLTAIPVAVAKSAIDTGMAREESFDLTAFEKRLSKKMNPSTVTFNYVHNKIRGQEKKIIFVEGDNERVLRASSIFKAMEYGNPILIGDEAVIEKKMKEMKIQNNLEIINPETSPKLVEYTEYLYEKRWRKGFSRKDCCHQIISSRDLFASIALNYDQGDALITGASGPFGPSYSEISKIIPPKANEIVAGVKFLYMQNRMIWVADTMVNENPTPDEMAQMAIQVSKRARKYGIEPRVAFISHSSFGNMSFSDDEKIRETMDILDKKEVNFEYEGEMRVHFALNHELLKEIYPHSKLTDHANILIMPGVRSARISLDMLQTISAETKTISSLLIGLEKPIQFINPYESMQEIINCASIACFNTLKEN